MTVVTVVFLIVCALWLAVACCVVYMIADISRMRRERMEIESRTKALPPPLPVGTWFDNISINQRDRGRYWYDARDGGMRWRATEPEDLMIRPVPVPPLTPETERALQIMHRMRDEQYLRIEHALMFGSQAYNAARRCDICGASTAEQKTERCRNACGQIHGSKATAVLWFDAAAWTGRRPSGRGVRSS